MNSPSRRDVLKGIGSTSALLVGGTGIANARGNGKRQGASAANTILDIVEASDDFDTLELALEETGLAAVLDGNGQFTVFAPTDGAFGDLLDALESTAEELLARDDLADILLYHVTKGRRYAASVVNAPQVEMANGETLAVAGTELNGGSSELGGADIITTNIEASNGVVHVIDGVLLPP